MLMSLPIWDGMGKESAAGVESEQMCQSVSKRRCGEGRTCAQNQELLWYLIACACLTITSLCKTPEQEKETWNGKHE